jgi:hypothetical protein
MAGHPLPLLTDMSCRPLELQWGENGGANFVPNAMPVMPHPSRSCPFPHALETYGVVDYPLHVVFDETTPPSDVF